MRGTDLTSLPECHLAERGMDGVVPRTESAPNSYNEWVSSAEWHDDRLLFNLMKHDLQSERWRDLTSSGYNHEGDVQPASLLQK